MLRHNFDVKQLTSSFIIFFRNMSRTWTSMRSFVTLQSHGCNHGFVTWVGTQISLRCCNGLFLLFTSIMLWPLFRMQLPTTFFIIPISVTMFAMELSSFLLSSSCLLALVFLFGLLVVVGLERILLMVFLQMLPPALKMSSLNTYFIHTSRIQQQQSMG